MKRLIWTFKFKLSLLLIWLWQAFPQDQGQMQTTSRQYCNCMLDSLVAAEWWLSVAVSKIKSASWIRSSSCQIHIVSNLIESRLKMKDTCHYQALQKQSQYLSYLKDPQEESKGCTAEGVNDITRSFPCFTWNAPGLQKVLEWINNCRHMGIKNWIGVFIGGVGSSFSCHIESKSLW